jgi:hypothetical protein
VNGDNRSEIFSRPRFSDCFGLLAAGVQKEASSQVRPLEHSRTSEGAVTAALREVRKASVCCTQPAASSTWLNGWTATRLRG